MASSTQYQFFKDCLARQIISQSIPTDSNEDASQLNEFSSFLSLEVWPCLPSSICEVSYETRERLPDLDVITLDNIPVPFSDSLILYGLCDDWDAAREFLRKVLLDYVKEACAPPPVWSATRTVECEMCEREIPLTYHHLIPRSTHTKVLKKRWHPESMLNAVAWLCRPCHNAVHHVATNEELARRFYTMQLLLERDDLQRWRQYAAKQRFGVKRG